MFQTILKVKYTLLFYTLLTLLIAPAPDPASGHAGATPRPPPAARPSSGHIHSDHYRDQRLSVSFPAGNAANDLIGNGTINYSPAGMPFTAGEIEMRYGARSVSRRSISHLWAAATCRPARAHRQCKLIRGSASTKFQITKLPNPLVCYHVRAWIKLPLTAVPRLPVSPWASCSSSCSSISSISTTDRCRALWLSRSAESSA